ncbi:MAG: alanine racemase, partial [Candidatus Stahlbacteria bacterium]|nr:alanine racemase [Candidatus Stahlbacteria bacterium]
RPGILLYGLYPGAQCDRRIEVSPILTWYTRVCRVNNIPKGVGIGYRRTYITDREQKVATLLIGYGDGYPRSLSNKGYVLIRAKRAKIVGSVCMDMAVVDVTDIPEVNIGDEATLIGKNGDTQITAEDVAALAGTINYEITTRIGPRVARVYTQRIDDR